MKKIVAALVALIGFIAGGLGLFVVMVMTMLGGDQSNGGDRPPVNGGPINPEEIPNGWAEHIEEAGKICPEFPGAIIAAQIETESGWDPNAVSHVGAVGLAQFMPETWAAYGVDGDGDGVADPYNPVDAIHSMGNFDCYLVEFLGNAGGPNDTKAALAAYNAGPAPVLEAGGIPPIHETQQYVRLIMERAAKYGGIDNGDGPGGPPPSDPTEQAAAVIAAAQEWEGQMPYSWGAGNFYGPSYGSNSKGDCTGCTWDGRNIYGFDCSGLMAYAYYQGAGLKLPRTTKQLISSGEAVEADQMKPGDFVIFDDPDTGDPYHVALFMGGEQFIHAEQPGTIVKTDNLFTHPFWSKLQWHPRRVL